MKTSIITHPFWGNYGGMLQAYALQTYIKRNFRINANIITKASLPLSGLQKIKYLLRKWQLWFGLTKADTPIHGQLYLDIAEKFRTSCVQITHLYDADRYIVGSDQVWRQSAANYLGGIGQFFLDFTSKEIRNQSITYAASFGTDTWEGNQKETELCKHLLHDFKAVSVREHSGVKTCNEVFNVNAVQMPDPTLLLHTTDYEKIIFKEKTWLPDGKYVAAYVLDETVEKAEILQESARNLNIQLQHLMPHADAKKRCDRFPISVAQWLRLIRDCEYLITDSFHGCVFAIIYNKPFVCIGNESRGNARFDTLLGTFGMKDRLITNTTPEKVKQVLNKSIDWAHVNAIHERERKRGQKYLQYLTH